MDKRTRIEKLRDLIEHPATPANERANAQRILGWMTAQQFHPWDTRNKKAVAAYERWVTKCSSKN